MRLPPIVSVASLGRFTALTKRLPSRRSALTLSELERSLSTSTTACLLSKEEPSYFQVQTQRKYLSTGKSFARKAGLENQAEASSNNDGEEQFEFQAETKSLLDIVAKSLYSDQEVFIRELISNAADALEKRRCTELGSADDKNAAPPSSTPYELRITTDIAEKTLTFHDTGIGMSRDELINLLGTIAMSGSKAFREKAGKNTAGGGVSDSQSAADIIGQFGVGFYSAFIVADEVVVRTKRVDSPHGYEWRWRGGNTTYSIRELEHWEMPEECGTEIRLHLKPGGNAERFASGEHIEKVIEKHSFFLQSPILLNGRRVNTMPALWTLPAKEVSTEQHDEFFKQLAHTHHPHLVGDRPQYTIQYAIDSPLNLRTLLYVPSHKVSYKEFSAGASSAHSEEHYGPSLYNRRVLVKPYAKQLLPHYLRFLVGVVDSEDVPLNLSREMLQMDAVLEKLSRILTDRAISFFARQLEKDRVKYTDFYKGYSLFFKEGIVTEQSTSVKEELGKLLLFETSNSRPGTLTTLPEYVERMQDGQNVIHYIYAPSRQLAETSPYYQYLQTHGAGKEVLLLTDPSDELVFLAMPQFAGRKVESVEKWVKQQQDDAGKGGGEKSAGEQELLRDPSKRELLQWIKQQLGSVKATEVRPDFKQASQHPLMLTVSGDMSAARHLLRIGEIKQDEHLVMLRPVLHVNFQHPIIRGLEKLKQDDEALAKEVIEQIYDNALVTAGLLRDSSQLVARINKIMGELISKQGGGKSNILTP